jgi:hypothetical protein
MWFKISNDGKNKCDDKQFISQKFIKLKCKSFVSIFHLITDTPLMYVKYMNNAINSDILSLNQKNKMPVIIVYWNV